MKLTQKHILLVFSCLACLAAILFVALIISVMMPPLVSFSRTHEKLPAVFVENGSTVYCRMRYCDFRFPLPDNTHVFWTNIDSGGSDTINGSISVVGTNGGPINLRHYAEFLQKKNWTVSVTSGFGCPEVTNNMPDVPFVSSGKTIHYPLFEDFGASLSSEEGGGIHVQTQNGMTQIGFSYFGDY